MIKTIDERLHELMEKIADKSAAAARRINEAAITIEEKIAVATQLLENAGVPRWLTKETMDASSKLVMEIRESSYAFDGPPTPKHNGVTDNTPHRESVDPTDKVKQELAVVAQRAFGLNESEARLFADLDDRAENLKAALMREGGRR